jgi:hypothetical protein
MQSVEDATKETHKDQPYRLRLPGFIKDEPIGLGTVVTRIAYATGIRPCGGCSRRTAAMNRWVIFTR